MAAVEMVSKKDAKATDRVPEYTFPVPAGGGLTFQAKRLYCCLLFLMQEDVVFKHGENTGDKETKRASYLPSTLLGSRFAHLAEKFCDDAETEVSSISRMALYIVSDSAKTDLDKYGNHSKKTNNILSDHISPSVVPQDLIRKERERYVSTRCVLFISVVHQMS